MSGSEKPVYSNRKAQRLIEERSLKSAWHHACCMAARLVTVVMVVFWLVSALRSGAAPAKPGKRPLLLAHYMPWFEAKPVSRQWGWHWTMNAFDPEQKAEGKRSIASHYYPLIGPYDSNDPAVIEYHLLLMKLAGIDGIIIDWYGLSDLYDYPIVHRNTQALVESAAQLGLQVGICYEDQTIPKLVEQKRLPTGDRVKHAQGELEWLRAHWFSKPNYLKWNGKPVLLSFGRSGLNDMEWEQVLQTMNDAPVYLSEHQKRSAASGTFDWPQPQAGLASVDTYYRSVKEQAVQSVKEPPVFMPAAFPRFHDIYKAAKVQEGYPILPDDAGKTFATTLERGLNSGAPFVQIATWNDWGEGTIIEPSEEFGYRDLETIQRLRRERDAHFAATPADLRLPYRLWRLRTLPGIGHNPGLPWMPLPAC